jgi:hypothetical protein
MGKTTNIMKICSHTLIKMISGTFKQLSYQELWMAKEKQCQNASIIWRL